jgi:uncharacterized protein YndB with AHSA1/START domain
MTEPVRARVHIDADPERVYDYFVRPEAMVRWMGETARLEPQPGGTFAVDVRGAPVRGRYVELDPPHRLVIAWGYAGSDRLPPGASIVEVRLTAVAGGTSVELEHRDLPAAEADGHAAGWSHYLDRLRSVAAGLDPGPDPGMRPTPLKNM